MAQTIIIAVGSNLGNLGRLVATGLASGSGIAGGSSKLREKFLRAFVLTYGNPATDPLGFLLLLAFGVLSLFPSGRTVASWVVCGIFVVTNAAAAAVALCYRYKGLDLARATFQALSPQMVLAAAHGTAAYLVWRRYSGLAGSAGIPVMLLRLAHFSAQASLLARRELKKVTFLEPWKWRSFPDLLWLGFAIPLFCAVGVHPTIVTGLGALHMTTLFLMFTMRCMAEVADHMQLSIWNYGEAVRRFDR